jgi:hypothetical protein
MTNNMDTKASVPIIPINALRDLVYRSLII